RGHREHPEHPDVEIGELQGNRATEDRDRRAERDHRERQERGDRREDRRQEVDGTVGVGREDRLFEEQLETVGERDQDAARTGPHRAGPRLEVGDDLPLHPDVQEHREEERDEDEDHPVDAGHAGAPVARAASGTDAAAVDPSPTASTETEAVDRPDRRVFAASPGWLKGTKTEPAATCSVTRSGTVVSPAAVLRRTWTPSTSPRFSASTGCISVNAGSSSASLSSSAPPESLP